MVHKGDVLKHAMGSVYIEAVAGVVMGLLMHPLFLILPLMGLGRYYDWTRKLNKLDS